MLTYNSLPTIFVCIRLEISITSLRKDGKDIPMLSVIDDGHGMSHQEIVRMLSFGRKPPDEDDPTRIGRFGIGFKVIIYFFNYHMLYFELYCYSVYCYLVIHLFYKAMNCI